ncbi:unnamed protein product [Ectocarpus sp. 12 AP-2014]
MQNIRNVPHIILHTSTSHTAWGRVLFPTVCRIPCGGPVSSNHCTQRRSAKLPVTRTEMSAQQFVRLKSFFCARTFRANEKTTTIFIRDLLVELKQPRRHYLTTVPPVGLHRAPSSFLIELRLHLGQKQND